MVRTGHPRRWNRTECLTFRVCNTRHNGLATGRLAFRCFLSHSANTACRPVRIHYYNTFVFLVFSIRLLGTVVNIVQNQGYDEKAHLNGSPPLFSWSGTGKHGGSVSSKTVAVLSYLCPPLFSNRLLVVECLDPCVVFSESNNILVLLKGVVSFL